MKPDASTPADAAVGKACLTVFHDGSCPLCQREIGAVKRLTAGQTIAFVDVSALGDGRVASDLSATDAMKRFHVRRADGKLLRGAAAFLEMWGSTPKLRLLRTLGTRRWLVAGLDRVYDAVLIVRPALAALVCRLERRRQRSTKFTPSDRAS